MGFKRPEGPLQNGRTYIHVRIWSGFPKSMDTSAFADVYNDEIEDVLGRVAAKWVREALVTLALPQERARAEKVPEPPTEVLQALSPQTLDAIGTKWMTTFLNKGTLEIPYFALLHAEDTFEHALAVVNALNSDANLGCPFEFELLGRHELALEQAVIIERNLLEWETQNRPFELIANPLRWKHHPLRRLRDNALKFSPIVAKMIEAESRPLIAANAPTRPLPTIAPEIVHAAVQPPEVEQQPPPPSGMMSAKEIADMFGVEGDPLRKRLERWRRANPGGNWIEVADRRHGDPGVLYDVPSVRPIVDELKASTKASAKRPSTLDAPP